MSTYNDDALKLLRTYMDRLGKGETKELLQMSSKWESVSKKLDSMITELSQQENLSKDKLFKLDLYRQFKLEAETQTNIFTEFSANLITDNQKVFIQAGLDLTQQQISLITIKFNKMNISAVKNMAGFTSEGTKLYDLLNKSYPQAIGKLTDTLIQSIALGRNPLQTASLMKTDMGMNLRRARVVARTEQLRVMRESSREQMIKSKVVSEWERIERDDACDDCQAVDGQRFSLDVIFETHPNCRGNMLPIVG